MNISETNTVRAGVGEGHTERESLISASYRRMSQLVIISSKG